MFRQTLLVLGCLPTLWAFWPSAVPFRSALASMHRLEISSSFQPLGPGVRIETGLDQRRPAAIRHGPDWAATRRSGTVCYLEKDSSAVFSARTEIHCDWTEVWLDDSASDLLNEGENIEQGNVVIVLPGVASETECKLLVGLSTCCARDLERAQRAREIDPAGLTRLPTVAAAKRAVLSNTPCADPLSDEADRTAEAIFQRVLAIIDQQLPAVATTLFASNSPRLAAMHVAAELEFTRREPAVNVYTAGGEFRPHKDHQALTVLVSLSAPGSFSGGGTAFWREDQARMDPSSPSLLLKPPPGTALLFGGRVTHAGRPVERGTRCVLVASFSKLGEKARRAEAASQSRDMFGDLI